MRAARAMVMATRVVVEKEGSCKGRKSDGNGEEEGYGNGDKDSDCSQGQWQWQGRR